MKKLLLFFLFALLWGNQLDTIVIKGNKYTLEKIIIREIKHPIPAIFQDNIASEANIILNKIFKYF